VGSGIPGPVAWPLRGDGRLVPVIGVGSTTEQNPTVEADPQTTCPRWTVKKRRKRQKDSRLGIQPCRMSLRFC